MMNKLNAQMLLARTMCDREVIEINWGVTF